MGGFKDYIEKKQLNESVKGIKWSSAYWDWKDMEGAIESLHEALAKMGIKMTRAPSSEGSDTYGYIFTKESITPKQAKEIEVENGIGE
jgi:hypothetical protein